MGCVHDKMLICRTKALMLVLVCFPLLASAQEEPFADTLRVMFYNVENLFDCSDDSLKDDSEYLPGGMKGWNPRRYWTKLANVSRVVAAVGDRRLPDVVGLCEVENEETMKDLTDRSPLRVAGYRFLMTSSPDERGVDVALLYQPGSFRPLASRVVSVVGGPRTTRDILHVSGLLATADTLDLFVCHLPSKYGGARNSRPFRELAAKTLRRAIDSLRLVRARPQILVMGDFNDQLVPSSAVASTLAVEQAEEAAMPADTLLYALLDPRDGGSYAYQGRWELIDHLLVSGTMLDKKARIATRPELARVVREPFLLQPDEKYGGVKPFRTHLGGRYLGGYSDHLPVVVDVVLRYR